MLHCTNTKFQW